MDWLALAAGTFLGALQAASHRPPEAQDPDRPAVSIRDFKGLRENNIFSPARPSRREHRPAAPAPAAPPPSPPPAKPRTPVVTGIVFSDGAWQVLVEDRNTDLKIKLFAQPRFLRAGEEFLGYRIESVAEGIVTVRAGDTVKDLRPGDSFPERVGPSPERREEAAAPAEGKREAVPPAVEAPAPDAAGKPGAAAPPAPDEEARRRVLEELKRKYQKKREELDFQEP